MDNSENKDVKKSHRDRRAGRKAVKKKGKNKHVQELTDQQRNPKAFALNSIVKTKRQVARTQDIKSRKHHIPVVNRTPLEPPPVLVAVVGGCKVGKTTLIRSIVRKYTRQKLSTINGPVTVVAGKKHRLTFFEVKNDLNCMVDVAKVADVVLMLIDIKLGIEMEVFEFLEICRAYGMPRVMGILNHLDLMKCGKQMRRKKKELTHRFQVELYPGAKLFSLSGLVHGEYLKKEINNLGRYITILKFRPLQFRITHPYVLVDRLEDITNIESIRQNPICKRNVVLYGYVRGIPMMADQTVHIPGAGDFRMKEINILDDPCPLPHKLKQRSLNSKERLLYAPLSGVAGVIYDKDAIYIDLGGSHHGRKNEEDEGGSKAIMKSLLHLTKPVDEKFAESGLRIFSHSKPITSLEVDDTEQQKVYEAEQDGTDDGQEVVEGSEYENEEHKCSKGRPDSPPTFEQVRGNDGCIRRRVVWADGCNESGQEDTDEEESETEIAESTAQHSSGESQPYYDGSQEPPRKKQRKTGDLTEDRSSADQQQNGFREGSQQKSLNLTLRLPGIQRSQTVSAKSYIMFLQDSIYGDTAGKEDLSDSEDGLSDDEEDNLFRRAKSSLAKRSTTLSAGADPNGRDSSKTTWKSLRDWSDPEVVACIRDAFVTGEWSSSEDAQRLLQMDNEDNDLYGDFEDLETGAKFLGRNETQEGNVSEYEKEKSKDEKSLEEKRLEKKRRLKEFFDSEYDDVEGDRFDALKAEMKEQSELNRKQFEDLEDDVRVKYEGFRAGLYVRMEFESVDSELVSNFDPSFPVIVGGLLETELNMGYVKTRLKVHRWFPRILKTRDPLYLSLGWRRFQTPVFYAKLEDNFRLRALKYARKFLHVEALFWAPLTELSSGFVAMQNVNEKTVDFSIAANGVVLETDQSTKIVKKLKLIGYPKKIYQKTAFIKDMFHSETEVVKFIGVKIRTQSSIRGIVKKAVGLDGVFRATFEDIIKMSDTIIMTTWVPIEIPKFCSIVKNLLLPIDKKSEWPGMKTNAKVKKEQRIRNPASLDSLYTEITERRDYIPQPLTLPRGLQKALPYKNKPKLLPSYQKQQRVVVVKDKDEMKMELFMKSLKTVMKEKLRQEKVEKQKKKIQFHKEIEQREKMRQMRERKRKAYVCKINSQKKSKIKNN